MIDIGKSNKISECENISLGRRALSLVLAHSFTHSLTHLLTHPSPFTVLVSIMTRSSAEQLYLKRLLLENLSSNANLRYLVPTHAPELAALYGETKLIVASISTRTELGERLDDILALVELSRYEGQEAQVSQLLEAVLLCPHVYALNQVLEQSLLSLTTSDGLRWVPDARSNGNWP